MLPVTLLRRIAVLQSMVGQLFVAVCCVGNLTVYTGFPEGGVDQRRNVSQY